MLSETKSLLPIFLKVYPSYKARAFVVFSSSFLHVLYLPICHVRLCFHTSLNNVFPFSSFLYSLHKTKYTHVTREYKVNIKLELSGKNISVYAPMIIFPLMLQKFESKSIASNNSLHSLL